MMCVCFSLYQQFYAIIYNLWNWKTEAYILTVYQNHCSNLPEQFLQLDGSIVLRMGS